MILKQLTTEWRMRRLGFATASRFRDIMTQPQTKAAREAGKWSGSAENYLDELLFELLYCVPADTWRSDATDWGRENEPLAFEAAKARIREDFEHDLALPEGEWAFIEHPSEPYIGCSPDGLIGADGLLELKCPYSGPKWIHAKRRALDLAEGKIERFEIAKEHIPQVQGQLWITDRQWTAYCWFDPRVKNSGVDPLLMARVERDEDYIQQKLAPRICAFRDWMRREYARLVPEGPF